MSLFSRFLMRISYAHTLPRISSSAFLLLVWHRITSALHLSYSTSHHLVRYCVRKEHDQIRTSDLFTQACRHLGKHLCLTVKLFADFLVLADHPVMTAYYNNTHIKPPESKLA